MQIEYMVVNTIIHILYYKIYTFIHSHHYTSMYRRERRERGMTYLCRVVNIMRLKNIVTADHCYSYIWWLLWLLLVFVDLRL